jgi:hypothetical protein
MILRFGDIDRDGNEDLLLSAKNKETKEVHTLLFRSQVCSNNFYGELGSFSGNFRREDCRYFSSKDFADQVDTMSKVNSYTSSFFDFGEYG